MRLGRLLLVVGVMGCESPAEDSERALRPGELQKVESRACAAPGPLSWRDRAEEYGLEGSAQAVDHFEGGAVALDDVDADGRLDLVVAMPSSPVRMYPALGSGREPQVVGGMAPMAFLRWDVDEDGGADLVLTGPMPSTLMRREGHYEEELVPGFDLRRLVALHGSSVLKQLVPFDADGDGDLDLYGPVNPGSGAADPESVDDVVLFRDGPMEWRTVELPASLAGTRPFDAAVMDRNGVDALYVANDMGAQFGGNQLFVGSPEGVEDITTDCGCGLVESAMADEVADVNGDGLEDIVIGSTFRSLLLLDSGDGRYVDASAATGVSQFPNGRSMSWAVAAEDFDNDGRMDIVIPQGDFRPMNGGDIYESPINALWQREDGTFEDRGPEWGFPTEGSHRATLARDMNGDGVLDFLLTQVEKRPTLLVSEGCTAGEWLEVDAPEGSRIRVEVGERVYIGRATADVAYGATAPPQVHFGLGEGIGRVDRIVVRTPDGEEYSLKNVPTRTQVAVPGYAFQARLGG